MHTIYPISRTLSLLCCLLGIAWGLLSCSDDDRTGEFDLDTDAPIGFYTNRIQEVGTRALIGTTADLRTPGFGVYGDKVVGTSAPQLVFGNIKVSGDPWTYEPTKYWDRTASYHFVAYAPYMEDRTAYDANVRQLTISDIPQWQEIDGNETDYLLANDAKTAEAYLTTYGGTVALEFRHLLAQLTVNILKDNTESMLAKTYKATALTIGQEAGVKVPITDPRDYTYDAAYPANTKFSDATTYGEQTLFSGDIDVPVTSVTLARYLVAPFDLGSNKMSLTLNYTEAGTAKTVEVPLDISKFESNCSYVFLLRFESGKPVVAKVIQVKDWESIEVTDDVYNW